MRIFDCQVEFNFPFENNGREQGQTTPSQETDDIRSERLKSSFS
jgi:hypothetical protein